MRKLIMKKGNKSKTNVNQQTNGVNLERLNQELLILNN